MAERDEAAETAEERAKRWLDQTPGLRDSSLTEEFRLAEDAALERAAQVVETGADEGPVYCNERACVAAAIRSLKSGTAPARES
jgi:hypothetical protein